jgi:DNA-binding MarR family transcriptional regulator
VTEPSSEALAAIHAWTRLGNARAEFGRAFERHHGVTGAQPAFLRLVAEHGPDGTTLAHLRTRLVLHPATLVRLVDRPARRGLVEPAPDPADRRRTVRTTRRGRALCRDAPRAGPVRLRTAGPDRLLRLAAAFDDALDLFGWKEWAS